MPGWTTDHRYKVSLSSNPDPNEPVLTILPPPPSTPPLIHGIHWDVSLPPPGRNLDTIDSLIPRGSSTASVEWHEALETCVNGACVWFGIVFCDHEEYFVSDMYRNSGEFSIMINSSGGDAIPIGLYCFETSGQFGVPGMLSDDTGLTTLSWKDDLGISPTDTPGGICFGCDGPGVTLYLQATCVIPLVHPHSTIHA